MTMTEPVARYRKKPVEIEARQLVRGLDDVRELAEWCGGFPEVYSCRLAILIRTLEGDMVAEEDDWIIKGVAGEFYPCKPDIFALTYEPVSDARETPVHLPPIDFSKPTQDPMTEVRKGVGGKRVRELLTQTGKLDEVR